MINQRRFLELKFLLKTVTLLKNVVLAKSSTACSSLFKLNTDAYRSNKVVQEGVAGLGTIIRSSNGPGSSKKFID